MKLKSGIVLHEVDGEYMAVATGDAIESFNGLVRNNETSNFICSKLLSDTTEEEIVEAMCAEYDAPREVIAADVRRIIAKLEEAGLIEK